MPEYMYTRDGDAFIPTRHAGSPWSATSQHGGPVNALFMRTMEKTVEDTGMRVARLTVDILKPVPMAPLTVTATVRRQGRSMATIDAELTRLDDAAPIALARSIALKVREDLETLFVPETEKLPGPEGLSGHDLISPERRKTGHPGFHLSVEVRTTGDGDKRIIWFTSPLDLVDGEIMTPTQRVAAFCDVTTIVSGRLQKSPPGGWDNTMHFPMLNTDSTMHLFRPPVGVWFGFSNSFIADNQGIGVAEVALHDERGSLGRSAQTVTSLT